MLAADIRLTALWLARLQIASQERFLDKRNYAYWVGRVQFTEEGERDRQRYVLTECGRRLREIGDPRAGYISINSGGNYPITVRTPGNIRCLQHETTWLQTRTARPTSRQVLCNLRSTAGTGTCRTWSP